MDDYRLVKVNTEEEKRLAAQEAEEAEARRAAVQARLAKLSKKQAPATEAVDRDADGGAAAASEVDDDTEAGFDARMRAQAMAKRKALGGAAPGPSSRCSAPL